ncbi:MAG: hypothetical protein Q9191_004767 [Dirinaria sp. TL-2023a]
MSGAEALAVVGLASNILQFIDFTSQLCERIHEITTTASGLPRELDQQAAQLSQLLGLLKELAQHSKGQTLGDDILKQCQFQAQELAVLLKSFEGGAHKGRWKNAKVALKSLRHTQEIEKLQAILDRLVRILGLQLQIEAKRAADQTGYDVSEVLKTQIGQLDLLQKFQDAKASNDRDSKPLEPIWMVPISRNPNFVGRDDLLEQLEDELIADDGCSTTAVLHGLGGIGKSQIALEYVFRQRSADTAVFWVYASNTSRFIESYKRIASECQIPDRDDPSSDTLQLVRDWLESSYRFEWLMVVDSVDDRAMFFEPNEKDATEKPLIEYMPQTSKGTIIYTTRSRDVGIDLSPHNDPIAVPSLNFDEAQSLLGKKIVGNSSEEEQVALFEELAYLPLAISQATAFMTKRRKTVADYLELLGDESTKSQLLSQKGYHHGRADRSSESITSTWWVTFQSMKRENARAGELLTMMCLLDRQEIPLPILQDRNESDFDFEEAVGLLEAFSLITTYSDSEPREERLRELLDEVTHTKIRDTVNYCDMHRLVQESTQAWLSQPDGNAVDIATKTLEIVTKAFPMGFIETWPLCDLLYPHADAILAYNFGMGLEPDPEHAKNLYYKASLLLDTSTYLRHQGSLRRSERDARISMVIHKAYFANDPQTLAAMESFALTIAQLGRNVEACDIQRQVLSGREKFFGDCHADTLEALNNLGSTLRALCEYAEAETLHRRELLGKRQLCSEDPSSEPRKTFLIIALANLAGVLKDQGEYEEALDLLSEALERAETLHGKNHHLCWRTMESLAICQGQLGRYKEAHELFDIVLDGRRELYGDSHPSTMITRGQYSMLLMAEGRYAEAEEVEKYRWEDKVELYGPNSYDCVASLHNLGFLQYVQKKYSEAESTLKQLLEIQINNGEGDPEVLRRKDKEHYVTADAGATRDLLRKSLEGQGKLEEAKAYVFEDSRPHSPLQEEGNSEVVRLRQRGRDLFDDGYYEEAEAVFKQELDARIKESGMDNEEFQITRHDIARSIHEQQRYEEAQEIAREVLTWRKRVQGWRHSGTQAILRFLAAAIRDEGRLEESEKHWRQLVLWQEHSFGKDNVQGYEAYWGLANVLSQQGKHNDAESSYRKILKMEIEHPNDSDPGHIAQTYHNLGCVLRNQVKLEEAEEVLTQAYERRVDLYGRYDGRTVKTLMVLVEVVAEQGKFSKAEDLYHLLGISKALPSDDDAKDADEIFSEDDQDGSSLTSLAPSSSGPPPEYSPLMADTLDQCNGVSGEQ